MIRVAVVLPVDFESGGEFLANVAALEAAGAYAALVEVSDAGSLVVLGAIAAVTQSLKVGCVGGTGLSDDAMSALERMSRGRAMVVSPGDRVEAWTRIEMPANRAAWKDALAQHEAAGTIGVIVPWDPRLIDLLRNPDAEDDRSDLVMSTG